MLINNKTSCQNSNFWSENEILIKNRNFCQKILTAQKSSSQINASENLKFSFLFYKFWIVFKIWRKMCDIERYREGKKYLHNFYNFFTFYKSIPKILFTAAWTFPPFSCRIRRASASVVCAKMPISRNWPRPLSTAWDKAATSRKKNCVKNFVFKKCFNKILRLKKLC